MLSAALVGTMTLVSCGDGDASDARRRDVSKPASSSVTTLPTPTTTTVPAGATASRVAYLWDDDVWVSDHASGANIRVTADRLLGYETAVRMHGPGHLTYATASDAIRYEGDVQSDIWEVDLNNGARTKLFHSDGLVLDFAWSPDGSTLTLMRRVTGSRLEVLTGVRIPASAPSSKYLRTTSLPVGPAASVVRPCRVRPRRTSSGPPVARASCSWIHCLRTMDTSLGLHRCT